jgi:hypothetical protein
MNFLKETIRRLTLSTPSHFRKLIYFFISLSAIGVGIQQLPESMGVPDLVKNVANHCIWIGAVAALVAKQPVKDPNQI